MNRPIPKKKKVPHPPQFKFVWLLLGQGHACRIPGQNVTVPSVQTWAGKQGPTKGTAMVQGTHTPWQGTLDVNAVQQGRPTTLTDGEATLAASAKVGQEGNHFRDYRKIAQPNHEACRLAGNIMYHHNAGEQQSEGRHCTHFIQSHTIAAADADCAALYSFLWE